MIKQRRILLFIIISILLLGAGAVIFLFPQNSTSPANNTSDSQPNENDTEINEIDGMKLYRNEEWGFEFWYPEGWEIKEPAFGSAVSKFNMDVEPTFPHFPHPITINILPNDWIERVRESFKREGIKLLDIQVDKISGIGYEHISEGLPQIDYLFPRENYWIVVGGKKQYENILNQILATLKFLK